MWRIDKRNILILDFNEDIYYASVAYHNVFTFISKLSKTSYISELLNAFNVTEANRCEKSIVKEYVLCLFSLYNMK